MKKTVNINLGGYPVTIDEDAYQSLEKYLRSVERAFSGSEGKEEIVHDIETRIAELFQEHLNGKPIVSQKEVDAVIQVMGKPHDFDTSSEFQEDSEPSGQEEPNRRTFENYQTGKRLFRDPHDKVVAGVASGLSAYFGIQDPVWLRIIFVVLGLFGGGSGIVIYFLLWVIVPEAKSASDRLSMKGEAINISNIAKSVEEELSEIGKSIQDLGDKIQKKHKKRKGEKHS